MIGSETAAPCALMPKYDFLYDFIRFERLSVRCADGTVRRMEEHEWHRTMAYRTLAEAMKIRPKHTNEKKAAIAIYGPRKAADNVETACRRELLRVVDRRGEDDLRRWARAFCLDQVFPDDLARAASLLGPDVSLAEFRAAIRATGMTYPDADASEYATADLLIEAMRERGLQLHALRIDHADRLGIKHRGTTRSGLARRKFDEEFVPPFEGPAFIGCSLHPPVATRVVALLEIEDDWHQGRAYLVRCLAPSSAAPAEDLAEASILPTREYNGQRGFELSGGIGRRHWIAVLAKTNVSVPLPWSTRPDQLHVLPGGDIEWLLSLPAEGIYFLHGCFDMI